MAPKCVLMATIPVCLSMMKTNGPGAEHATTSQQCTLIFKCHWHLSLSPLSCRLKEVIYWVCRMLSPPPPRQIFHTHHPSQTPSNTGDDYPYCMDEETEATSMDHLSSSDLVLDGTPEPNSPGQRAHSTAYTAQRTWEGIGVGEGKTVLTTCLPLGPA